MKNKSLYTILTFFKINTKRVFRDKTALFFTILFPLIFLFVFGSLNSGGNDNLSFDVAVINESGSGYSKEFANQLGDSKVFKVVEGVTSIDEAKDRMGRSELDAAIVLPSGFGDIKTIDGRQMPGGEAKVVYTQNNSQSAAALQSVLSAQFNGLNSTLVDTTVPFTVTGEQLNERSLSAFDYTFAGLLGFSIIGMGIFGPINVFPELKKMGILRRLSTTPLKVWQYFIATMMGQVAVGLIAMTTMFVVAVTVFHLNIVGNLFELGLLLMLGIITILGIGLALGGWAKNERQVAPLANIVVFPMMFLSGTFFPRFLMPEWLQTISGFLPLTPVIEGIRMILTEGKHLVDILPQLGLIGLWAVVIYAIAFRVFRWE